MILSNLDSNVVLRLILNDVPEQASRAARFVDRSSCYVTDVVVAECVFVLEKTYKLDRGFIKNSMATFFKINTVNLFILILPINLLTNILFVQSNIGKAMVHVASFI